jgi:hypothetical protein
VSSTRMGNRLDALERNAPSTAGAVHVCVPPACLSDAEYDAWQAEQMRSVPDGATPIFVRFVSPAARRARR